MPTLQEYKCPCCGGAIGFDSGLQKMKCPFCDTEFEVETLAEYDAELKLGTEDDMSWQRRESEDTAEGETLCSYVCRSCGGEIVGDENTAATFCPFCGNPVVMLHKLAGEYKPDIVIPFKLDKAAAKAGLAKHLTGKKLLPKLFKDENHIDEVKGVYVPFWLFDTDADAHVHYRAEKLHIWSDSRYNYTETLHFLLRRSAHLSFEHVPVDASKRIADELMESIEPYSYEDAVDFKSAYLAGYFADKYDVDSDESKARANERVKSSTEQAVRETIDGTYSSVRVESSNVRLQNGRVSYALYPVWILNTTWKSKKYTFAMNGQTGKFAGDLPVDRAAAAKWFFSLTAAVGALSYLAVFLLNGFGAV